MISGLISRVKTVITHIQGLVTPLITSHEPPSRVNEAWRGDQRFWGLGIRREFRV